ncbi:hypothetical protein SLS60_009965 [Paraconiothyrium brasiliense]|uniref:Uncharacterized protein n=1 Tax=Paraconiothyrium brasiliense TaxID=300254 RepID=A0ABR3QT20_9PLEO
MTVIYSLATVLEYHCSTGTWKSHRVDLLGQNVTLPELLRVWILTKKILRPEEGKTEEGKDYLWYELDFFTWWNSSTTCRVLCIGAPQEMNTELKTLLVGPQPPSFELQDPFAMLRPLFDEIIKLCDENTWRVAKSVRVIERVRRLLLCNQLPLNANTVKFQNRRDSPDFEGLRNLARHTGHLVEVEQVAIETMEQLVGRQESNFKNLNGLTKTYEMQAKEYLLFQLQMMKSLRWRAQSTQDRLEEEITLVAYVT